MPEPVKDITPEQLLNEATPPQPLGSATDAVVPTGDSVQQAIDLEKSAEQAGPQATPPVPQGNPTDVKQPDPKENEAVVAAAANATKQAEPPKANALESLMASEKTLTEEFRSKAATIFEDRVREVVDARVTEIEESYNRRLAEEKEAAVSNLVEKVDAYLGYVVEGWLKENQVAIDAGLRTEVAEGFMNGLKSLFNEHYVAVPEGREDVVEKLTREVETLKEELNKAVANGAELLKESTSLKRQKLVSEVGRDLAATELARFNTLVEEVTFEDAEAFAKKISSIKEGHFRKTHGRNGERAPAEVLTEETSTEGLSPSMTAYVQTISRTEKANKLATTTTK